MRLNCVCGILYVLVWNVVMCCYLFVYKNRWLIKIEYREKIICFIYVEIIILGNVNRN